MNEFSHYITKLYPLKPIGLGSPYVESLSSYIARLAKAHFITVGRLVLRIIVPTFNQQIPNDNKEYTWEYKDTSSAIGTTARAQKFVEALESLTGQPNIKALTFLPWKNILFYRNLLRKHRAWCPKCLREWEKKQIPLHEPLMWSISLVEICPVHKTPLQTECPYCKKQNYYFGANLRIGYCTKCGKSLYKNVIIKKHYCDNSDYKEWIVHNFEKLIETGQNLQLDVSADTILDNLNSIVHLHWGGNVDAFARTVGIHRSTVRHWIHRLKIPSTELLFQVCYVLNIELVDLFLQPNPQINFGNIKNLHVRRKQETRKPTPSLDVIESVLHKILEKGSPYPSITSVCKQNGFNRNTVKKYFPDHYQKMINNYKASYYTQIHTKREKDKTVVRETILELLDNGEYPGFYRVQNEVRKITGLSTLLRAKYAKDEWIKVMKDSGLR